MLIYILSVFVSLAVVLLCFTGMRNAITIRAGLIALIASLIPMFNICFIIFSIVVYYVEYDDRDYQNPWLDRPLFKKK